MSNVLILRAPGTNCDNETAFAFEQAGAKSVTVLHINRILESPKTLNSAQILCIPGGFSFGDDVAAGRIFATKIRNHLADAFRAFKDAGKLILGICNGFQVLIKSGVLFDDDTATLTWNASGMYTDRWVPLKTDGEKCVFLRNIESLELPIAHAEGRFVPRNDAVLQSLNAAGQLALRYAAGSNPNGATADVAGACDSTGRVFGLMPHPERHLDALQHPRWTRRDPRSPVAIGDGLAIFRNAVTYFG
jgi:phosphoribosylformylglycinamidine synthase